MLEELSADFLGYLSQGPSPWHAAQTSSQRLQQAGFAVQDPHSSLPAGVPKGVLCQGGAVLAWIAPRRRARRLVLGLAHTDSPCLRLRPHAEAISCGCRKLSTEVYGGALNHTWLDRELELAGRICLDGPGGIETRLVRLKGIRPVVPSLAIHLDRQVNERGLVIDRERHLAPLAGLQEGPAFLQQLARESAVSPDRILSWDLCLGDANPPALAGFGDLVVSPRLDNLASCHALVSALETMEPREDTAVVVALLDAEEVGSLSPDGADSFFLTRFLERLGHAWGMDRGEFLEFCQRGLALSVDMAHAVHPNHPERHSPQHAPFLGQGPVLKWNAGLRYGTDAPGAALVRKIAAESSIPLQTFAMRADLGCGSTVGPIVGASLSLRTVDCGAPMLSMHSARETMALVDQLLSTRLYRAILENA